MEILGPERYRMTFDSEKFVVECPKGTAKFSGLSTTKLPKLYVVSINEKPIYVGVTKQPIRNRLRFGWKAVGETGYYGYRWRHSFTKACLDVWCHADCDEHRSSREIETVEAEVAYLIRRAGQWPLFQTEIHFHPSDAIHRHAASVIVGSYALSSVDEL